MFDLVRRMATTQPAKDKNVKQLLLRIALPEGRSPLYAAVFREMLAKAGDGSSLLPPAFFHYGTDGNTLSCAPDIRFVGGRGWVGILSRSGDNALFDMAVGIASRVVGAHYGVPVRITIEQPEYGFEATDKPVRYHLRDVAIKTRSKVRREASGDTLTRERLLAGLVAESQRMDLDLPGDDALGIQIHDLRQIGMRLGTTTGATNEFVTLINADVSMFLNLGGIWQIGSLQSRGYGRIVKMVGDKALPKRTGQGVLK